MSTSPLANMTLSRATGGGFSSLWDGLSPHLIARMYEVDIKGNVIPGGPVVYAPFSGDVTLDIELNWQSPFEGSGADALAPAITTILQSGAGAALIDKVGEALGANTSGISGAASAAIGRSGMTKLNSTQIFTGMPPLRIQGELLFRAWANPTAEVEDPTEQLIKWALPKKLAPIGTLVTAALDYATSDKGLMESMLPSETPSLLAITYKGRTYSPVVIERVQMPLSSPIDSAGRFTQMRMPITIASLAAIDRHDWVNMKRSTY